MTDTELVARWAHRSPWNSDAHVVCALNRLDQVESGYLARKHREAEQAAFEEQLGDILPQRRRGS